MAKYNLLDDDDIFEEEKKDTANEESAETPKAPEGEQELEINIDDDFDIEPASLSDDEFKTDVLDPDLDEESKEVMEKEPDTPDELDENPHFDDLEPEEEQKPEKETPSYYTDDYDDDKQTGVNYAPFIKAFIIILVLTGIYFLVDIFILSDSDEVAVEQQEEIKTPEQLKQEQEAAAKAEFLSRTAGKINSDVQFVADVVSNVQGSAKLGSALYYGDTFLLKIFGRTRSDVAKAQRALKKSGNFEINTSDTRPGANGGVISTYSLEVNNSSGSAGQVSASFSTVSDFEGWVSQTSSSKGLKVAALKNKYLGDEDNFKKYEIMATLNGSIDGCSAFLQNLAADGNQVKIHKLNLSATDQRSFKSSKYQLKLILVLFI